jgi:hypothetical protein
VDDHVVHTYNNVALQDLPLIIRDVGYHKHGVAVTPQRAQLCYEQGTFFPGSIHPLLKDLMARVMGMDPDDGFEIVTGEPQAHEQPFDIDTVCKGHVAVQRFETVLEALNRKVQEKNAPFDLRLARNAIVHFESRPDELIWGQTPLVQYDHASGKMTTVNGTVTGVLVKHPWMIDRRGSMLAPR